MSKRLRIKSKYHLKGEVKYSVIWAVIFIDFIPKT